MRISLFLSVWYLVDGDPLPNILCASMYNYSSRAGVIVYCPRDGIPIYPPPYTPYSTPKHIHRLRIRTLCKPSAGIDNCLHTYIRSRYRHTTGMAATHNIASDMYTIQESVSPRQIEHRIPISCMWKKKREEKTKCVVNLHRRLIV